MAKQFEEKEGIEQEVTLNSEFDPEKAEQIKEAKQTCDWGKTHLDPEKGEITANNERPDFGWFKEDQTFEDVIRQFKKDHPFTPGPKIQLGAIPDDVSCGDAAPGIRLDDSILIPVSVYSFLIDQLNKNSLPQIMVMFEKTRDLDILENYFQTYFKKYLGCEMISQILTEELEQKTGINEDSPIFELALFVHYHLSLITDPQELVYLFR